MIPETVRLRVQNYHYYAITGLRYRFFTAMEALEWIQRQSGRSNNFSVYRPSIRGIHTHPITKTEVSPLPILVHHSSTTLRST